MGECVLEAASLRWTSGVDDNPVAVRHHLVVELLARDGLAPADIQSVVCRAESEGAVRRARARRSVQHWATLISTMTTKLLVFSDFI